MLDSDLADIYGVSTKRLNQQFIRNKKRFPADFAFQLDDNDIAALRLHFATSKAGRGGRRYRPYGFTEHGAVMLSSILNTPVAIEASIRIARAFIRLRDVVASNKELAQKMEEMERRLSSHDARIMELFEAIRELAALPDPQTKQIGFRP